MSSHPKPCYIDSDEGMFSFSEDPADDPESWRHVAGGYFFGPAATSRKVVDLALSGDLLRFPGGVTWQLADPPRPSDVIIALTYVVESADPDARAVELVDRDRDDRGDDGDDLIVTRLDDPFTIQ